MKKRPITQKSFERAKRIFLETEFTKTQQGCWIWPKSIDRGGYGRIVLKDENRRSLHFRTNRLAWEVYVGPIPDGLHACHLCDNPPCCNPDHLVLGTARQNAFDRKKKGRSYAYNGHKYDKEQIKAMINDGKSIKAIALELGAHRTTIEKAVRRMKAS